MAKKPPCADFIIAVMRERRFKTKPIGPVNLVRIWEYVQHHYSETEFRKTINSLLRDGTIVGVWRISKPDMVGEKTAIHKLPNFISLVNDWTHVDKDDKPLDASENRIDLPEDTARTYWSIKLYVAEDKIPQHVQKLVDKMSPAKLAADQLMEKLQGQ